jgi:hypothetical protein
MIREAVISGLVGMVFGGASVGTGMKFYADHIYESQITAKETHEALEVDIAAVSSAQQKASNKQRIRQLQGWIKATRRGAERQDRPLTTAENNDITEWQTEIDNLKGW